VRRHAAVAGCRCLRWSRLAQDARADAGAWVPSGCPCEAPGTPRSAPRGSRRPCLSRSRGPRRDRAEPLRRVGCGHARRPHRKSKVMWASWAPCGGPPRVPGTPRSAARAVYVPAGLPSRAPASAGLTGAVVAASAARSPQREAEESEGQAEAKDVGPYVPGRGGAGVRGL